MNNGAAFEIRNDVASEIRNTAPAHQLHQRDGDEPGDADERGGADFTGNVGATRPTARLLGLNGYCTGAISPSCTGF